MTKPLSLVVLLSGEGSNLQAMIDAIANRQLQAQIVAVISDKKSAKGLQRAEQHGISTYVIDAHLTALCPILDQFPSALIVLAGFMRILPETLVTRYEGRIINIHPALLPKYPGLHTHARVLAEKSMVHGSTVHFVNKELDGGPIIAFSQLSVMETDTVATLTDKIKTLEHRLYPRVLQWFAEGRIQLRGQQVALDGVILPPDGIALN